VLGDYRKCPFLSATSIILAAPVPPSRFAQIRGQPGLLPSASSGGLRKPSWAAILVVMRCACEPELGCAKVPGLWWLAVCLATAAAVLTGCGHPATRAECEEIFERSAEIELRSLNVTDADEMRRRTDEARDARGPGLLDQCIGRRITDRAMGCVREAQTAEEIDACLM